MSDVSTSLRPAPDGWFVVWTESRAEKMVESRIASLGLEPWLPTVTERRRWSDRWREVETPLFPGYLFARPAAQWHTVLHTPGVLTVVKSGGRPAQISDNFIQQLRGARQLIIWVSAIARGMGLKIGAALVAPVQ